MYFVLHCALIFLCRLFFSSQQSITKHREEAEALGLGGKEALNFVYMEQEFYRNERAAERTARAEEREA